MLFGWPKRATGDLAVPRCDIWLHRCGAFEASAAVRTACAVCSKPCTVLSPVESSLPPWLSILQFRSTPMIRVWQGLRSRCGKKVEAGLLEMEF